MRAVAEDRNRVALVIVVISSMVVVLSCIGSVAAIKTYHVFQFSPIVVHLGRTSIAMEVTNDPGCSRLIMGCPMVPRPHKPNYLTIWAAITTQQNGGQQTAARRILILRVH
jgi:hypothetical protein